MGPGGGFYGKKFLKPTMDMVAKKGFAVGIVELPGPSSPFKARSKPEGPGGYFNSTGNGYGYPDRAGEALFYQGRVDEAVGEVCDAWTNQTEALADAIKNGLCTQEGVDCASIAVAGFAEGDGFATALSTPGLGGAPYR